MMIFGFALQFETVWNRELEGIIGEYEPAKAKEHLHLYKAQYGKKFNSGMGPLHCQSSTTRAAQVFAPPGPDIHLSFRTGSMGGGKIPFHDFYFPNPPVIRVVCFYHCTSETDSALQAGALTSQTYFYSFLPSQRKEKSSFFWCFYNQQLPINFSLQLFVEQGFLCT